MENLGEKIDRLLEKTVSAKIEDFSVTVHSGNKKGEAYLSDIIVVTLKNRKTQKDLHVFVKLLNSTTNFVRLIYQQEIYFYNTILQEFNVFQNAVLGSILFKAIPKCLAVDDESQITKIALEDVGMQGFKPHYRSYLDNQHMELIVKTCGQFHGISLAYKYKHSDNFSKIERHVRKVCQGYNKDFIAQGAQDRMEVVRSRYSGPERNAVIERLKMYAENGKEMIANLEEYTLGPTL